MLLAVTSTGSDAIVGDRTTITIFFLFCEIPRWFFYLVPTDNVLISFLGLNVGYELVRVKKISGGLAWQPL